MKLLIVHFMMETKLSWLVPVAMWSKAHMYDLETLERGSWVHIPHKTWMCVHIIFALCCPV